MQVIQTNKSPGAIGPYSQAIAHNGMLYCSGQIPICPETGLVVEGDIEVQTLQVMKNIAAVLEAGGTGFEKVVKTTCFLADMKDFAGFNRVYGEWFVSRPARSCVAVKQLPKDVLVEVEVLAAID